MLHYSGHEPTPVEHLCKLGLLMSDLHSTLQLIHYFLHEFLAVMALGLWLAVLLDGYLILVAAATQARPTICSPYLVSLNYFFGALSVESDEIVYESILLTAALFKLRLVTAHSCVSQYPCLQLKLAPVRLMHIVAAV